MTATLQRLGSSQINVLRALKDAPTGFTAPQLRNEVGLGEGDYGTRRAIAVLNRLIELGLVTKEAMSDKVAEKHADPHTGRRSKHRFKINGDGKKALKALS
jgi:hypothetical protein